MFGLAPVAVNVHKRPAPNAGCPLQVPGNAKYA